MRWRSSSALFGMVGAKRVVRKFLWLPTDFGTAQYRWFEFANVVEEVCRCEDGCYWIEMRFEDEEPVALKYVNPECDPRKPIP